MSAAMDAAALTTRAGAQARAIAEQQPRPMAIAVMVSPADQAWIDRVREQYATQRGLVRYG